MSDETMSKKFERLTATEDLLREWQGTIEEKMALPVLLVGMIESGPDAGSPVFVSNCQNPELIAKFLEQCIEAIRDPEKLVHERK